MKMHDPFKEYFARIYSILVQNNYSSLACELVQWFDRSTLPQQDKMILLRTLPFSESDMKRAIDILKADYDFSKIIQRDDEFLEMTSIPSEKGSVVEFFKNQPLKVAV